MRSDCPECTRLWERYLEARRELAALKLDFDTVPAESDHSRLKALARKARTAANHNETARERLAAHERDAHGRA